MEKKIQDLSKLNDRHQFEVFKSQNFTGKTIKKIKFNNIHFIDCDFTGSLITSCEFNQKCLFSKCKFNKTTFLNVRFNETSIRECTFEGNTFNDVNIESSCEVLKNEFIGEDFKVNNFWIRGQKISDINKLVTVVEVVEEQVEDPLRANRSIEDEKEPVTKQEFERESTPEEDMKLYNVLFPAVMKQYPDLKKTDGNEEYIIYVNDIEFAFCQDTEYNLWRGLFFVRDTDDVLGSVEVLVPTNQVITYDSCADAFKTSVKLKAVDIMSKSTSEVIKNSFKEFIKVVFKETDIVTEDISMSTLTFVASVNPDDVVGDFNCGFDNESKELVTIFGQPFNSSDTVAASKVRDFVRNKLNISVRDDYISKNYETQVQAKYAEMYPYSCYVTKASPICTNAYLKPFGPNNVVLLKK